MPETSSPLGLPEDDHSGINVALVEDTPTLLHSLARMVRFRVAPAVSAHIGRVDCLRDFESAEQALLEQSYDVIILDIMLQDVLDAGFTIADGLVSGKYPPNVICEEPQHGQGVQRPIKTPVVIVVSAINTKAEVLTMLKSGGIRRYIEKPFNPSVVETELIKAFQDVIAYKARSATASLLSAGT